MPEQLAFQRRQPVELPGLVEQLLGQQRDVVGVLHVVVPPGRQRRDRARAEVHRLRPGKGGQAELLEDRPLAQAPVADGDPVQAELVGGEPQHQGPSGDEVHAARLDAGEAKALGPRDRDEAFVDRAELLGRDAHLVQRRRRPLGPPVRGGDARDRPGRPAGRHRADRRQRLDLLAHAVEGRADPVAQPPHLALARRIVRDDLAGEPGGPDAQRRGPRHAVTVADGELEAPAAEVQPEGRPRPQRHARPQPGEDEPRLVEPVEEPNGAPRSQRQPAGQGVAVRGVAEGAGRQDQDSFGAVTLSQRAEARHDLDGGFLDVAGDRAALADRPAEADRLAIAQARVERAVGQHVGDEEVERGAAQVEDGESHPCDPTGGGRRLGEVRANARRTRRPTAAARTGLA